MKRLHKYLGFGALGIALTLPLLGNTPVLANLQEVGANIAQIINRPKVELNLSAHKKMVKTDQLGKEVVTYQDLGAQATVLPGETLRYQLESKNEGDVAAGNLTLSQPIPSGMTYLIGSAASNNNSVITYKLNDGYERPADSQEFEAEPQILVEVLQDDGSVVKEIQAAPAEAYAQVRWEFDTNLSPQSSLKATYEVVVN
ncbi:MAG: DUF11 domain-containing protein [Limnothrix sp. RL_2_0]|nr:DUF11 domain-containing protein [Limnothrix sp. RL_2_0]